MVADAVAVLSTTPASTSAWVTTCGAEEQVTVATGARLPAGQETAPAVGSATVTPCTVTVPVFCTRKVQVIWSPRSIRPSPLTSAATADLVRCRPGTCCTAVSVELGGAVTGSALGSVAVAVAVLDTTPASTSAWVTTCAVFAVQVVEAPGAKRRDRAARPLRPSGR